MNNVMMHANSCQFDADSIYLNGLLRLSSLKRAGCEAAVLQVPLFLRTIWAKQFKSLDAIIARTAQFDANIRLSQQQIKDLSLFFYNYYIFDPVQSFQASSHPRYQFERDSYPNNAASAALLHAEMVFLKECICFYLRKHTQALLDHRAVLSQRLGAQFAFMASIEPALQRAILQNLFDATLQHENEGLVIYHKSVAHRIETMTSAKNSIELGSHGVALDDLLRIRLMEALYQHYHECFKSQVVSPNAPQAYYDHTLAERCANALVRHLDDSMRANGGVFLTPDIYIRELAQAQIQFASELELVRTILILDPSYRGHFSLVETTFAQRLKKLERHQLGTLVAPILQSLKLVLDASEQASCLAQIDALHTQISDLYRYGYSEIPKSFHRRALLSVRNFHRDIRRITQSKSFKALLVGSSLGYLALHYFPQGLPKTWQGRLVYYVSIAFLSRPISVLALLAEPLYYVSDELWALWLRPRAYLNRGLRALVLLVAGACYAYLMYSQQLSLTLLVHSWPLLALHAYAAISTMALGIKVCRHLVFGGKLEDGRFELTSKISSFLDVAAVPIRNFFEYQSQYLNNALMTQSLSEAEFFRVHELKHSLEAMWDKIRHCKSEGLLQDWTLWSENLMDFREGQMRKLKPELDRQLRHLTYALIKAQIKIAQCSDEAPISQCHRAFRSQQASRDGENEPARYLHAFAVHQMRTSLDELNHTMSTQELMLERFQVQR